MEKIKYKDLSGWLKFAIIISWMIAGYITLSFLVGISIGITS